MPLLRGFQAFPAEAALIGRMLAEYADLEIDLMHCAKQVRGELDHVLKSMFRNRGNTARINITDALAHQPYLELKLRPQHDAAIAAVRHCLKIRNLHTRCVWWDDNTGQ